MVWLNAGARSSVMTPSGASRRICRGPVAAGKHSVMAASTQAGARRMSCAASRRPSQQLGVLTKVDEGRETGRAALGIGTRTPRLPISATAKGSEIAPGADRGTSRHRGFQQRRRTNGAPR